jgi:hypothetical protein
MTFNAFENNKKKKKKSKNQDKEDEQNIIGEFNEMFEHIDMNDGDESNAIPVWHSQCTAPKKCISKHHVHQDQYNIDYIYGSVIKPFTIISCYLLP